jgi:hypothetical protein
MDGLSLTSSIAGLISLATEVVCFGYTYCSALREYEQEVLAITNEISQLSGILHALQLGINEPETEEVQLRSCSLPMQHAGTIIKDRLQIIPRDQLIACEQTLVEITQVLAKLSPQAEKKWKNLAQRMQWPLKRGSLKELIGRLERHKTTFIIAFSSHGT